MSTKIFYFSATGNNLSIAKKLQAKLGDVDIYAIKDIIDKDYTIDSECVGFIFPIYAWGIPAIVKEFISRIRLKNVQYTFAVTGCAGVAGNSVVELDKILRNKGVQLNAGFIVKEPSNTVNNEEDNKLIKFVTKHKGGRVHLSLDDRIEEVSQIIANKRNMPLEKDSIKINALSNFVNKLAVPNFKSSDKEFWTTDECDGCGICAKICSRKNIRLVNKRPEWLHNCEACTACINWCPKQSIQSGDKSVNKPRYQKEGIKLEELL